MIIKIFAISSLLIISQVILYILHYNSFPYYVGAVVGACIFGILSISNEEMNKI